MTCTHILSSALTKRCKHAENSHKVNGNLCVQFIKGFRNTETYMYHENSDIGPFIHTVIKIGNIKPIQGGGTISSGDHLAKVLRKRITIVGSLLRAKSLQYKESLIADFTQRALPHFSSGEFRPIIDTIMTLDDIKEAHVLMESNKTKGKIILKVQEESTKEEL